MKRNKKKSVFLRFSVLCISFFFLTCSIGTSEKAVAHLPNIVLIMADDLGYETLGCNGGLSYQTPKLDAMAAEGIRFTSCFSQPLCTPSRVKIMTGQFNFRNYEHFEYLRTDQKTFANYLKEAGYATAIAGKWQLNGIHHQMPGNDDMNRPLHFGFDEYCLWQLHRPRSDGERYADPLIYCNGRKVENLENAYGPDIFCDFVCDFIERKSDVPFFVYYPMVLTHDPFVPTPKSASWADPDKRYVAGKVYFKDMVEYMDGIVGRIEQKLKDKGLMDNTLIIFTADNGTSRQIVTRTVNGEVQGGKGLTTNAGNHVPMIAKWPSAIPPGQVSTALVSFADILPTFLEIANLQPGDFTPDGFSLLPLFQGEKQSVQEEVFIHYSPRWGKMAHNRWVTDGNYKLYRDSSFYNIKFDPLEHKPLQPSGQTEINKFQKFKKILDEKEHEFPFEWNNRSFQPANQ